MLESQTITTCPTPEEVETIRYAYLANEKGYAHTRPLLDDIASMVARGQVTTLPVCHPSLYGQVQEITEGWSFSELHSCASHHRRQCPISLKDLRDQLDKPEYEALRYVLLKLATERPSDTPARRVLQMIGGFDDISKVLQESEGVERDANPADIFDMTNFEELWFIAPELSLLFNMRESSEISRASRNLSQTHGHYIVRRPATVEDYLHVSRRYTYLYRPATFAEKVRSLVSDGDYSVQEIAQESDYSAYEIQQLVDQDTVPVLNPFDTTQHSGEVNFEEVENFLKDRYERTSTEVATPFVGSWPSSNAHSEVTACDFGDSSYPYYPLRTPVSPQYNPPIYPATPVMPVYTPLETVVTGPMYQVRDDLQIRVEAILLFARETGVTVEVFTLVKATSTTLNEVLAALSNLDTDLLNMTLG